jgi:phosphoribosylanthranilate isomerase
MRVRVKICGIARPGWALAAAEAGADAVGLVFAEGPRRVTPEVAAEIVRALPPWVTPVGVFVDEPPERVLAVARAVGLGAVQLHGDEPPEAMAALGTMKVIKAVRIGSPGDLAAARAWRERARALGRPPDAYLVDALVPGGPRGGTGRLADWSSARQLAEEGFRPLVLAGGLGPENVAEAVRTVRPWGVDGSSGLESAPGVKDPARMRAFVEAVRECRL